MTQRRPQSYIPQKQGRVVQQQTTQQNNPVENDNPEEDVLVDISQVTHTAESFLEHYSKYIISGALAIALLVASWLVYQNFIKAPREREAIEQSFQAENMFRIDSFAQALSNPGGGYPGFLKIAEDYSHTKAGNLANYYAGCSYMHLGQFDSALKFLKAYNPKDDVTAAMTYGLIGDAESEKNNFEEALKYYKKAAVTGNNDFKTPYYLMKTGLLMDKLNKGKEAVAVFKEIKMKYPNSAQARDIERYLTKAEAKQ
jgi:TolA-binding protein